MTTDRTHRDAVVKKREKTMYAPGIIVQLALLTFAAQAPAAAEQETASVIELASEVDEVTVSTSGAMLTRSVDVTLPQGLSRLEIILSENARKDLDDEFKDSFTVLASGAEILHHNIHETNAAPDVPRLKTLRDELRQFAKKAETAEERILGGTADVELLESVARTIAETRVELDSEALLELIESINTRRRAITEDLARQKRVLTESLFEQERLTQEIENTERGTRRLLYEIVARSPGGDARITIKRRDEKSTWSSEVEVVWNSLDSSAMIRLLGKVHNRSGIDWNGVRLSLDTGSQERTRFLAPIKETMIDILEEEEEEEKLSAQPVSTSSMIDIPRASNSESRDRKFMVEIPVTVRQGEPGLVLLEDFETPFSTSLIARPMVAPGVHLIGAMRNRSNGIIPKGGLQIIKDGTLFANTMIPMIEEKSDFQVPMGIQSGLVITRRLVSSDEVRTGLLNGGKLTTLVYKITLRNLSDQPCQVRIEDMIPVSTSEDIKVTLKASSPAPVVTPQFAGTLEWLLMAPAGKAKSSPVSIDWEVTVAHSADLETTQILE